MKSMSKFQIILLSLFGIFILIGVAVFSFRGGGESGPAANLLIWGIMPSNQFSEVLSATGLDKNKSITVNYVQKNKDNFDIQFLEALASGVGPDLFFLNSDSLLKYQDRVYVVPFGNFSEREFKNSFVDGAEIFLRDDGILGFPLVVDPLVMYWNRDIFNAKGIVNPPRFWEEIYNLSTSLTRKDISNNITKSAVALGEYSNISNAFEILSALIMQAGNPIISRESNGVIVSLNQKFNFSTLPAEQALSFYTEFSNSDKVFYSWNRSLSRSKDYFLSGDLGLYFGLASELFDLKDKNPNLNFDVAMLPQAGEVGKSLVYGSIDAVMISKQSRNIASAFLVAKTLSGNTAVSAMSKIRSLPPVRRDLLSQRPERAYMTIFYDSAIISRTWLVPDAKEARSIFKDMIESVTSGRNRVTDAVNRAQIELMSLINK